MRSTPAAQEFRAPTAARMEADMEEEDEKARVWRDRLAAERARAAAEARRVRVIEDAAAQAEPRRAATLAALLESSAAMAATAARSLLGRGSSSEDFFPAD